MIWTKLLGFILPTFKSARVIIGLSVIALAYILYTQYNLMSLELESLKKDKQSDTIKIKELQNEAAQRTKEYQDTIKSLEAVVKEKGNIQGKYQKTRKELQEALQGASDACLKAEVPESIRDTIRRGR